MREFLWSEEMADACVYLMENIDFVDLIDPSTPLRDRITQGPLHSETISPEDRIVPLAVAERSQSVSPEVRNTHINIGTGKEISIKDLAYLIKEKVGFGGELVFNTTKPDGTMRKLTDPSKIHALSWHHKIEIDEGIEKLYSWYLKK